MASEPHAPTIGAVAVLGLGLIGGSVGLALRGKAARVAGWDLSPASAERALERGAVDSISETAAGAISDAELIVLCAPLPATLPLLSQIAPHLPADAVVTDVGSLKAKIVHEADRLVPQRFVGGHPMAGSEEHGIEAARADLFQDAPWLITPTEQTGPRAVQAAEQMARAVGAEPRPCGPVEHDRIVAALSHLPHLLAYGLAQSAADLVPPEWRDVAAGSFRDGTRVAASNPELWRVVFQQNRDAVLASLDAFDAWTAALRHAIETGDDKQVGTLLRQANDARRSW